MMQISLQPRGYKAFTPGILEAMVTLVPAQKESSLQNDQLAQLMNESAANTKAIDWDDPNQIHLAGLDDKYVENRFDSSGVYSETGYRLDIDSVDSVSPLMSEENAELTKKTFWDTGWEDDSDFIRDFKEFHPEEFALFKGYAQSIDMTTLSDDLRYEEIAWMKFDSYAREKSFELIKSGVSDIAEGIYGPENAFSNLPGAAGSAIEAKNAKSLSNDVSNTLEITAPLLKIISDGPQVINEKLFKEFYGRGYDRSLYKVIGYE